jgi:acyl-CoA hydrolase
MPLAAGDSTWPDVVRLQPISQTHDPDALRALSSFWAVNSAFEVDVHGCVNAEYVGAQRLATGGGLVDFVRAAHAGDTGAAVIALPSRTRYGRSRIRRRFDPPTIATVLGTDIDFVVTEYGVARLHGLTDTERARAIAEVAHPDDRGWLLEPGT